jgi:hypothetical protein
MKTTATFDIWEDDQIPYLQHADALLNLPTWKLTTEEQQIIPFLGAGVSISGRSGEEAGAKTDSQEQLPDADAVNNLVQQLGFEGKAAKLFMRMAVFLAFRLQADESQPPSSSEKQLLFDLQNKPFPPSARELARLFSILSKYSSFQQVVENLKQVFPAGFIDASDGDQIEMLKLLAKVTMIADPPDALASITSYYECQGTRRLLWNQLHSVISGKRNVTDIHRLVAAAAWRHLSQQNAWDYLILTTNYDCLMEDALDAAGVDYVVLATRKLDQKVSVRFSDGINDDMLVKRNSGMYPNLLNLVKPKSLVVIYKLHGCLYQKLTSQDDGVVISDNDYVDYISQMNTSQGTIPAYVNTLMQGKPFLFLGYSLNDWNVRSVFETLRKKRGEDFGDRDYSVMRYVGAYEKLFFQRNLVSILKTDLNSFVEGVVAELQVYKKNDPQRWGEVVDKILSILSR